jgi:hypothetical protein
VSGSTLTSCANSGGGLSGTLTGIAVAVE